MPDSPQVRNDEFYAMGQTSEARAAELDLQFLSDVIANDNIPEYLGYHTRVCRKQGRTIQPKTKVVYLPPAEHSTMATICGNDCRPEAVQGSS